MSGETARMEGPGFALQKEAELETLTLDVLKSTLKSPETRFFRNYTLL